jgi:hypothetical protein
LYELGIEFGILGLHGRKLLLDRLISLIVFVDAIFKLAYLARHAFRVEVGVGLPLATERRAHRARENRQQSKAI